MDHKVSPPNFIDGPHGRLAYRTNVADRARQGKAAPPGLVWLGGYASDMDGTKAAAIHAHASAQNLDYLRFDFSGHGHSDGEFEDGTIGRWTKDAAAIIAQATKGPQVLIGSSMGGWIAGLLARQMAATAPERIAGMILIAPAPDFTTALTPHQWSKTQWETLQRQGRLEIPSGYDDSVMVYTKALFDDGAEQQILNQPLPFCGPVRMIIGMRDDVVPWQHAMLYADHIQSQDVALTLVKDGDHRMSSPADINRLCGIIDELTR